MQDINLIIKTIDEELDNSGKPYILLAQANKVLFEKGLFSNEEVSKKTLKLLLEEGKIAHAYQTEYTPKQWRIPLSNQAERKSKNIVKQKINKPQKHRKSLDFKWLGIGLFIVIVTIIFFNTKNIGSDIINSIQIIKSDTYAATSEEDFDEMFSYFRTDDQLAIFQLQYDNRIKFLATGTEVHIISYHHTHFIVRIKGTTKNLWVVREHIIKN